jgi:hypothetical protein
MMRERLVEMGAHGRGARRDERWRTGRRRGAPATAGVFGRWIIERAEAPYMEFIRPGLPVRRAPCAGDAS